MSSITIFSAPKAFSDPHINTIQRNAIRSWKALGSQVEVFIIGEEDGMAETAAELGVGHIAQVARNEEGTPLVNSIFSLAHESTTNEILIYLNADILLLPECLAVIESIHQQNNEYLLVGRRWDLNITKELDFSKDWFTDIEQHLIKEGKLCAVTAMDYFIFPRHLFREIPAFAIGRAGWDNWMIYHAVQQPWPVIDITPSHRVIHQIHDYRHLPNGVIHYDLEESQHNILLAGGMRNLFDLLDVSLIFEDGRIRRKKMNLEMWLRKMERFVTPEEQKGWRWRLTRILRKSRRKVSRYR